MPSIGIKYWGRYVKVPDNHEVVKGRIYESRGSFNQPIPEDIALGFLKDWKAELEAREGIIANYIEVNGTNFTIQWRAVGTPEPGIVSVIVAAILAVAVLVAAYYALTALAGVIHETGVVLSILGPENVSLILNALFLFFMLMMLNPLISMMAEIPRRILRRE